VRRQRSGDGALDSGYYGSVIKTIKLQMAFLACVLMLIAFNCQAQSAGPPRRPQELRLASMSAKLFYETSGIFSQDVFTGQVNLWNTPIEGASREGASESMLVTIEIKAQGEAGFPPAAKFSLSLVTVSPMSAVAGSRRFSVGR
jgi:hypothetical protein